MNLDITHTLLIISTLSTIIFTEDSRFDFGLMENTELLEVLRQEDLEFIRLPRVVVGDIAPGKTEKC